MSKRQPAWRALVVGAGLIAAGAAQAIDSDKPPTGAELSATQIVEKNVAARGGLEAWRKVQTMVWIGHIQSPRGPMPSLPFMMAQKRPNKTHFEINAMGQKTMRVFDGVSGWKVRAKGDGSPDLLPFPAQDARFARDGQGIDGPLIDYEAKGNAVSLDGTEKLDGRKAYRLSVRLMSGQIEHVWVDGQSFLEIKSDRTAYSAAGTPAGTATTYYADYKTFDGLQLPTVIETGVGSTQGTDRMVIERVVVNPPLQDRAFTRAAAEGPRQKHFAQGPEAGIAHPAPQPPVPAAPPNVPPAATGPAPGSASQ